MKSTICLVISIYFELLVKFRFIRGFSPVNFEYLHSSRQSCLHVVVVGLCIILQSLVYNTVVYRESGSLLLEIVSREYVGEEAMLASCDGHA